VWGVGGWGLRGKVGGELGVSISGSGGWVRTRRLRNARRISTVAYLTESANKLPLQKSVLAQIRQLILYHYEYKESVDDFVCELTCAKRRYKKNLLNN
jgi:hypothetical protein